MNDWLQKFKTYTTAITIGAQVLSALLSGEEHDMRTAARALVQTFDQRIEGGAEVIVARLLALAAAVKEER